MIDKIIENTDAAAEKTQLLREYVSIVGADSAHRELQQADGKFHGDAVYEALFVLGGIATTSRDIGRIQGAVDDVLALNEKIGDDVFAVSYGQLCVSLSEDELMAPLAVLGVGFNLALAARYEHAAIAELGKEEVSQALATAALGRLLSHIVA